MLSTEYKALYFLRERFLKEARTYTCGSCLLWSSPEGCDPLQHYFCDGAAAGWNRAANIVEQTIKELAHEDGDSDVL